MSEQQQAPTVGQTAGLPGANAHPATAITPDDQTADTVSMGDVATPVDQRAGADEEAAGE